MQSENLCSKKLIVFNADDFGMSAEFNEGVKSGFQDGFLTSACICANGLSFEYAVNEILPQCPGIGLGVHLNIIEGKTTRSSFSKRSLLCNSEGLYSNSFHSLLAKSKNKNLLNEIEADFRNQIEIILSYAKVDHLNSHVHVHGIPDIFEITCKLAKEYNIPFVRTQHEHFYIVPGLSTHLNFAYPLNLVKIAILNSFTAINKKTAAKYEISTNDYIIGVGYTGLMNSQTIASGIENIKAENGITEVLIHPCSLGSNVNAENPKYKEFLTTQDVELWEHIKSKGWTLTNYKHI